MHRSLAFSSLLSLALAACARAPAEAPDPAPPQPTPAPEAPAPAAPEAPIASVLSTAVLGHHWRLQDATDASGQRIAALLVRPDQPLQLNFADGRVSVLNACNRISGPVRIEGDRALVGALISTKMACVEPAINALDAQISSRLREGGTLSLQESRPPELRWTAANGDVLRFVGEATAQSRFNHPGDNVFLEIAAEPQPCPAAQAPTATATSANDCLKVRELRFDAEGMRVNPPGAWITLALKVEGFTHEPGMRTVIRAKRFPLPNAADGRPQASYVYEATIETEIVAP